jgi:hypothetical protein
MWRSAKGIALLSSVTALLVPAAAEGTVTIGSNLGRAPDAGLGCGAPRCTLVPGSMSAGAAAPGGLVSPVNGMVVTWRVRTGTSTNASEFRVVRLLADGTATASATSPSVTPPLNTTQAYSVQMPIKIGETIGINCCGNPVSPNILVSTTPMSMSNVYRPTLVEGGSPQVQNSPPLSWELAINADIEPTATLGSVKAKPRKGGKIKVTMVAPNPGTLFATGKGLHSTARKQVPAAGPFSLVVKPYFLTKRKLADGKTVKAKLKLSFTPTGGSAALQALKVKLKR